MSRATLRSSLTPAGTTGIQAEMLDSYSPWMGGLDWVANLVRAMRLGALALVLIASVGGSWVALQPGSGRSPGPSRPAGINHESARAQTVTSIRIFIANGTPVNPVCLTPTAVTGWNTSEAWAWSSVPGTNGQFQACRRS